MTESHKRVQISEIEIGDRFRQDFGDISALVDSIKELGLLQPVGVTEDNQLVFGERRLRAAKELGWSEIDVRVVDVPSIVEGEFAENEVRKDFTPSERVAIAEAVRKEIGERRGRPTEKNKKYISDYPEGVQSRDIASKKAGFGNPTTYEQAKSVVENGTPELQEAMDKKDMSISAAASVAKLPPEEQNNVVQLRPKERKQAVREIRQTDEERRRTQERIKEENAKEEAKQDASMRNFSDLEQVRVFINCMDQLNALSCSGSKLYFLAFANQKEYIRENLETLVELVSQMKEASNNGKVAI